MNPRRLRLWGAVLVAVTAALLLSTADRRQPPPRLSAMSVRADGIRLRVVRTGAGPAVVFIHGFGESLVAWRGVYDVVARDADAIALDLPGFGLSAKPPTGYTPDTLGRAVLRALDALEVRQAVLVGHSLGGAVAAAAAIAAPQRVRALVLVDAAVVAAPWTAGSGPAGATGRTTVAALRDAIARYETVRARFTTPHDPAWLQEDDTAQAYDIATDPAYRASLEAVLREFDFAYLTPARAAGLRMPVLLLWGRFDQVVPLATAGLLRQHLPAARLQVIERSWHRPHVERPDVVADSILAFLRGLKPPAEP